MDKYSFEYITDFLDKNLNLSDTERMDFLHQLGEGENLAKLIYSILYDESAFQKIIPMSFRHRLGFSRITIATDPTQTFSRLRIHIWEPDCDPIDPKIHNHICDFSSKVISGQLHFKTYQEHQDDNFYIKYEVPYQLNGYEFLNRGMVGLRQALDISLPRGGSYTIDAMTPHIVKADKSLLTSTLCFQSAPVRSISNIYTPSSMPEKREPSSNFSIHEIRSILNLLLKQLS